LKVTATPGVIARSSSVKLGRGIRYAATRENNQLFASKYKLVLPSEDERRPELEKEQRWLGAQPITAI